MIVCEQFHWTVEDWAIVSLRCFGSQVWKQLKFCGPTQTGARNKSVCNGQTAKGEIKQVHTQKKNIKNELANCTDLHGLKSKCWKNTTESRIKTIYSKQELVVLAFAISVRFSFEACHKGRSIYFAKIFIGKERTTRSILLDGLCESKWYEINEQCHSKIRNFLVKLWRFKVKRAYLRPKAPWQRTTTVGNNTMKRDMEAVTVSIRSATRAEAKSQASNVLKLLKRDCGTWGSFALLRFHFRKPCVCTIGTSKIGNPWVDVR